MTIRCSVLFFMITSIGLIAQTDDIIRLKLGADDLIQDTIEKKTEISSASRSLKFLDDLPVTVQVITRHEILENGYNTLVDVLKDVPGMKVSQPGSGIDGETFLMNGLFGNYYCKVLVNGIPVTPSVASGTAISGNLPVRQADRIEIISGPSAALYGSDALAGVINIITRESDRPVWTQADLSVGSQNFYNMNVMIGGKFGRNKNVAEYSLYGNFSQTGDMKIKYDTDGNYKPSLYNPEASSEPNYRGTDSQPEFDQLPMSSSLLGFGMKYRGIKANFDHMERKNHSSIGQSTGHYAYYDPSSYWAERIDRISLSYSNTLGKWSSSTLFSYLYYRLNNHSSFHLISDRGNEGVVYKYAASDDFSLDEILTFEITQNLELSGGFSFQASSNLPVTNDLLEPFDRNLYNPFQETISIDDSLMGNFGFYQQNFYNMAGYLQLYYVFGKMTLLAGGRWDEHSLFGSTLSPKIGLLYKLNDALSFRLNYGNGFRAPSFYYLYKSLAYPVDSNGVTYIRYENIPNPDADPERFSAFEFGVRLKPHKKMNAEFILKYQKIFENLSYSAIPIDPAMYPNASNQVALAVVNDENSSAEIFIGQVNLSVEDLVSSIHLNSDLYITYSKGREILPNNFGALNDFRNMPNWLVQWNFDFQPAPKWVVLLHNTFSSAWKKRFFPLPVEQMELAGLPVETKGYYTMDLVNRFKINRNFHAFLIINNVFDAEYGGIDAYGGLYDLKYNPQYGRNFRLGFSFTME